MMWASPLQPSMLLREIIPHIAGEILIELLLFLSQQSLGNGPPAEDGVLWVLGNSVHIFDATTGERKPGIVVQTQKALEVSRVATQA